MFKSEDFKNCMYDPLADDLMEKSERLDDFRMLYGLSEKSIRYIITLYDPATPIKKEYPDLDKRKECAAKIAGFDIDRDKKILEELYTCRTEAVSKAVINFLKIVNNRVWAQIVATEQTIWEYSHRLLQPIDRTAEDETQKDEMTALNLKAKMSNDLSEMNDNLDTLLEKFYQDAEEVKQKAVIPVKRITSEGIAKQLKAVNNV